MSYSRDELRQLLKETGVRSGLEHEEVSILRGALEVRRSVPEHSFVFPEHSFVFPEHSFVFPEHSFVFPDHSAMRVLMGCS